MNLLAVGTTFLTIFLAELPDKTMVATMVLSTRYHHGRAVWLGATAAFAVHVTIAVVAGGLLTLLPAWLVQAVVAVLFVIGAVVLIREGGEVEEADVDQEADATSSWSIGATTFGVVFLAEWGDLTQLATASLAAKSGSPVSVWLGALLALSAVAGIAVVAGRSILRVLPVKLVRRIAAGIFFVLAIVTVVEIFRG